MKNHSTKLALIIVLGISSCKPADPKTSEKLGADPSPTATATGDQRPKTFEATVKLLEDDITITDKSEKLKCSDKKNCFGTYETEAKVTWEKNSSDTSLKWLSPIGEESKCPCHDSDAKECEFEIKQEVFCFVGKVENLPEPTPTPTGTFKPTSTPTSNPTSSPTTSSTTLRLNLTLSSSLASLSWNSITNANSYNIYRSSNNSSFSRIGVTDASTRTFNATFLATNYYYKVGTTVGSNTIYSNVVLVPKTTPTPNPTGVFTDQPTSTPTVRPTVTVVVPTMTAVPTRTQTPSPTPTPTVYYTLKISSAMPNTAYSSDKQVTSIPSGIECNWWDPAYSGCNESYEANQKVTLYVPFTSIEQKLDPVTGYEYRPIHYKGVKCVDKNNASVYTSTTARTSFDITMTKDIECIFQFEYRYKTLTIAGNAYSGEPVVVKNSKIRCNGGGIGVCVDPIDMNQRHYMDFPSNIIANGAKLYFKYLRCWETGVGNFNTGVTVSTYSAYDVYMDRNWTCTGWYE